MKIAIAGVGGIGTHILNALRKTPHSLSVLSTRKRPDLESLGVKVSTVDYWSHDSLVAALRGVDLCICAIPSFSSPDGGYQTQLNLIRAAEESGVSKYVPSEWEPLPSKRKTVVPFQQYKNQLIEYLQSHPMRMTWTCFSTGFFLDYYSPTALGTDGKERLGSSKSLWHAGFTFILELNQRVAEIPGDGNTGRVSMTAADDIGGFVAAACTQLPLSQWPVGEWGICGGSYTPNEVVAVASGIIGPLKTEQLSREVILSRYQQADNGDVAQSFRWKVLLAILNDELHVGHQAHGVNFKPQTLIEFLTKWWPRGD